MPALTPKLRDALQCAASAPNYTLTRCRAGFHNLRQAQVHFDTVLAELYQHHPEMRP